MFADFDIHVESNVLSILESPVDGTRHINVLDLQTKQIMSNVNNSFSPLGPLLDSNGEQLLFFSNNGELFMHNLRTQTTKVIFDSSVINAGFCTLSQDNLNLCFSGYNRNMKAPPNIYYMHITDQNFIQLTDGDYVDRFPQWSPSGQYIAFHRQDLRDSSKPKMIYIIDVHTKEEIQVPYSIGESHTIGRYCWSKDSTKLLVKVDSKNHSSLKIYDLRTMTFSYTIPLPNLRGGIFFSNENNIVAICKKELIIISFLTGEILKKIHLPQQVSIRDTLRGPALIASPNSKTLYLLNEDSRIYQIDLHGNYKLLLQSEDTLPPFKHRIYEVTSQDGLKVPVHHFTPEGNNIKNTGILLAIGGPGENINISYDPVLANLIIKGYEVIVPAYRGCDGHGRLHKEANKGEYGRRDVWDILACGKDWKIKNGDERPLALIGYSYGGFLTFLSMTYKNNPFDYAVSLWGVTRLEYLKMHLQQAYPAQLEEKAVAKIVRNPIKQAHKIKKPLLIFHGEKDTTSTTLDVKTIQKQILAHGGTCDVTIFKDDTHGLSKHLHDIFDQISLKLI